MAFGVISCHRHHAPLNPHVGVNPHMWDRGETKGHRSCQTEWGISEPAYLQYSQARPVKTSLSSASNMKLPSSSALAFDFSMNQTPSLMLGIRLPFLPSSAISALNLTTVTFANSHEIHRAASVTCCRPALRHVRSQLDPNPRMRQWMVKWR